MSRKSPDDGSGQLPVQERGILDYHFAHFANYENSLPIATCNYTDPGPVVVHGDWWGWGLRLGHDGTRLDEGIVHLADLHSQKIEVVWHDGAGRPEGLIFG